MDSEEEAALAACAVGILAAFQKKKRRKKRLWARSWLQRRQEGRGVLSMVRNELMTHDPEAFTNFLRMNKYVFEQLLKIVLPSITKSDTVMRECIPAHMRLAVTIRFLATGKTYRSLMYSTRIHETTLSRFIPEVMEAIYESLKNSYLKIPNSGKEWEEKSYYFQNLWQFPNCIGAMDGKHIAFRPPRQSGSTLFNYKGFHSIILLGIIDAKYRFIYVNVGVNGKVNDGRVFAESSLAQSLARNKLNLPNNKALPGKDLPVPYVIVADSAFPSTERIMKPYPARDLTNSRRIFNYRLSTARRTSENAFGIMANRFRILLQTINLSVSKVESIVLTVCALHNFLINHNGCQYTDISDVNQQSFLVSLNRQGGNRTCNNSSMIRKEFEEYFNSATGSVPWQNNAIANNQA